MKTMKPMVIDPVAVKLAVKAGLLAFSVRYNNDIVCADPQSGEAVVVQTAEAKDSKKPRLPCPYCEGTDGGHMALNNSTIAYSGIEIAMSTHCKHLRARAYPEAIRLTMRMKPEVDEYGLAMIGGAPRDEVEAYQKREDSLGPMNGMDVVPIMYCPMCGRKL